MRPFHTFKFLAIAGKTIQCDKYVEFSKSICLHTTQTMSKAKKGYSQDEKCQMMVDFLVEKMQPYTLKELENIVPKVKQAISTAKKNSN